MHKVWAVIRREFVERVRTKWFWISAVLGPVLFAGVIVFQIKQSVGGGVRRIAVLDTGKAGYGERTVEALATSKSIRAYAASSGPGTLDSLSQLVESKEINGILIIDDSLPTGGTAEYRASSLSLQTTEELQRTLNRVIEKARLEGKGVNPAVVDWAQALRVNLDQKKCQRGACTAESAGQSFIVAYFIAILLFMAILLYGVNVMSSVLEEKRDRIVEVLVSSLPPFQLMLGKVFGAGAVSFFQFLIWGVSARILIGLRAPIARALGADASTSQDIRLPHIPFDTLVVFMTFFLGGFLLYSAMFAAVGAMSSNEQEARQAQQPVTYLLMISYLSIIGLTNEPTSTFAKTLSIVPFTSPIATPVRWSGGSVGIGELLVSIAMLLVAIVGVTWVAARIYRVGILMTGKRPTVKELVRWVRTA